MQKCFWIIFYVNVSINDDIWDKTRMFWSCYGQKSSTGFLFTLKQTTTKNGTLFDIVRCPVKFITPLWCFVGSYIEYSHIERAPYNFLNSPIWSGRRSVPERASHDVWKALPKILNKSVDASSKSDMSFHGKNAKDDLDVYIIEFSSWAPYGARESLGRCYHTDAGWSSYKLSAR